ncbi:MAG: extracellular solute-binding protein, partial [Anaerolineae bacterium]|nr:extracellular solute-binding protein [Anaerolineae bacterium]
MSACGPTPAPTPVPPTPTPEPAAPTDTPVPPEPPSLEEAAKEEGALMVYTSMNIDDLEPILAKFMEKYPFIKAEYYRASGEDVLAKASTEAKAGQHFADVLEGADLQIFQAVKEGLVAPYVSPEVAAYPEGASDPNGMWTVSRVNAVVIAYNTELVKPEEAPKSYEDLLDPKWQGKIGVEQDDVAL